MHLAAAQMGAKPAHNSGDSSSHSSTGNMLEVANQAQVQQPPMISGMSLAQNNLGMTDAQLMMQENREQKFGHGQMPG